VSLTTTLELMRTAVRYTADVVAFTDKHPDTRINVLINQGLGALSRVCRTTNPEFQPIASTTVTTDGDTTTYALPSNFRSLISVEYTADGFKEWLVPFEMHERAALTTPDTASVSTRACAYRIIGTNIELLPLPPANQSALLWYATSVTQLATDAATFDTMERLDSYVIWWAAREIAMEREAWERYDRLTQRMQELEGDIRILARSLDLSHPSRIVRTDFAHGHDRFGRRRG
jgi:hypothetical protein